MIVELIGKNSIYKTHLPSYAVGNYWISDEQGKKLVNLEGKNGKWYVVSNNNAKIISPKTLEFNRNNNLGFAINSESVVKEIALKDYHMNYMSITGIDELFILYCAPVCEKFVQLDTKNFSEIFIGNSPECSINYKNPLIRNKHARIFYSNGKLMLEKIDQNYGMFINNKPILNNTKLLFNGDVIFILGLKIIIIGKNIFINNPSGMVKLDDRIFKINEDVINFPVTDEEDEEDIEIYSAGEYFARAPRITNVIEREKVRIDAPPQIQSKEGMPLIYLLGSTLSMGAIMLITGFSSVEGLISGSKTFAEVLPTLLITFAMFISMILLPIFNVKYEKKQKIIYEQTRQKRYVDYINSKIELINQIMNKQRKILFDNYASAEECNNIILTRSSRLWERKIEDYDFLEVRLGIGDVPLDIDIEYPQERFTMQDDNLVEILNKIGKEATKLKDAPITVSLAKKNVAALLVQNNDRLLEKFIQSMLMQLITFHSYEDLKLVFLMKKDVNQKWEHIKMLPHVWNNTKQIRFFADDYSDMQEISRYLEEELENRLKVVDSGVDYKSFPTYYLIITDDYKKIAHLKIITEILKTKVNVGFSIFCITDNMVQLPNECKTFISLEEDHGMMFESEMSSTNQKKFDFDSSYTFFFERICKEIANIPIKYTKTDKMLLPENYTFLEMYNVGRIEQLNILERWKTNDPTVSLQVPVGVDSAGMPIILDIHEKAHGPHGLIAGSTGSGKSEFIITYILSLAVNYHPDDLTFILIDYKGGGIAGAFQKNNVKLPHLVGTITNIDTVGLQRSLISIQSELRRRQIMFNEARNKIEEGTMDIYKYQKLYHEGIIKKPMPHLLVICDEFAELKQQQEEFMNELISVARIGRSLGVHLILATQKPAGIVNDQIRSNSKFGICFKVQDSQDSMDVIKRPDAAELKSTGQFYMQVGNNEYFTLGLSAWSGAQYMPTDINKKKVDTSIGFISNIGRVIKQVDNSKKEKLSSHGEQLTNIVRYICDLAKYEQIKTNNLWIDPIPETIFVEKVRQKYHVHDTPKLIKAVIGEYDDPFNQRQGAACLNLSNGGNTIIYGSADSGKETLLATICYDTITNYKSDDVQLYLFDFGSEALKVFRGAPHVGDVVFINDKEKISRAFEMFQREIRRRTAILSDYGGDYNLYVNTTKEAMPTIVVIINNYEAFSETYEDEFDDIFLTLTREGSKCGIVFITTVSSYSDIRYRLAQNFKQKIALQLNNEDDYLNIWDGLGRKRPSRIFGRGLIKLDDIYEFQVAKICEPEKWSNYIQDVIEKLNESNNIVADAIPVLPDRITKQDFKEYVKDITNVPIGIERKNLAIYTYDFKKNFINIITAKNMDYSMEFALHIAELVKDIRDVNVIVFDAERTLQADMNKLNLSYRNFVLGIDNNLNQNKHILSVIIGVDRFINDVADGDLSFAETLKKAKDLGNYSFIIVDNFTRLKNHEYDAWYKRYCLSDSGIWVGSGVNDQYLINFNINGGETQNNCGNSFGCVIKQGEPTMIKLLGMNDKG